jgi:5'-deoxynucleotidase
MPDSESHFYAYISRIRWVQRWGLKRNTVSENVMEHSWEVATIAHVLAVIRNNLFGGTVDTNAVVTAAIYHDCSEVITGDVPSPIKYHSQDITKAYKSIEHQAKRDLLDLLPEALKPDFSRVLIDENIPLEHRELIKAADTLAAYKKCQMELAAGNGEFSKAAEDVKRRLEGIDLPEVRYFLDTFGHSYSLTLDELLKAPSRG